MNSGSENNPFADEDLSNVVVLNNSLVSADSTSSKELFTDATGSRDVKLKFQIESNDESSNERWLGDFQKHN